MNFLEKDLEDIVFEATFDQLHERGLFVKGKKFRQLRIGNYGIADMVTLERPYFHSGIETIFKGCITIYEFKKDEINLGTFNQIIRYAKGVKQYLEKREMQNLYNIELVTIGKSICKNSNFCYITDLFNNDLCEVSLYNQSLISFSSYLYNYNIDGLSFEQISDLQLKNEGF